MVRTVGTTVRGIITPIIKEGDDLVRIVVDSVLRSMKSENYSLRDMDVLGITESLVARAQGNFIHLDDIAADVNRLFTGDIGLIFPILSRNRFLPILKAMAMTKKKIYIFLNYPSDELGNHLMQVEKMSETGINPYTDLLTEEQYRKLFGDVVLHPFTGIDYVALYKSLAIDDNIEIYLTNDPRPALDYAKEFLVANIHDRFRTKEILLNSGAEKVLCLDDILTEPVSGKGYNAEYGLLGSNMATETSIKLFPRECNKIVMEIQETLKRETGKHIEVMVYGDGAFKDPQGKIWELADPVVSPGYTPGLEGIPNEIKLKYIADSESGNIQPEDMADLVKSRIKSKDHDLMGKAESSGTTPRQLTDLLGSLCDLTSGSGDKGTPIVLVQGYFDNYASE
ncbi:MAG TPA: coenzyme F420-0:L-glutamate ligase [Clostridia bacterium]|nr:coenzyme F420-0:L-glutamate ligase [Clostridia bacterium]